MGDSIIILTADCKFRTWGMQLEYEGKESLPRITQINADGHRSKRGLPSIVSLLVACSGRVKFDRGMPILNKAYSTAAEAKVDLRDPRVQICEGVLYFDGSPNQLTALIIKDTLDAVQRKRLEDLGRC